MSWLFYAFISAFAASATAILAKIGIKGVPSNLATAVRTLVVLLFARAIVFAGESNPKKEDGAATRMSALCARARAVRVNPTTA